MVCQFCEILEIIPPFSFGIDNNYQETISLTFPGAEVISGF